MFTRSPQCVHSVEACSCAVTPGAVPNNGLSASGDRPRQPLMHSVDPTAGIHGMNAVHGTPAAANETTDADALRPSISERLTHVRHIESGLAIAFESAHRSSSSQSPTWIVCVTMSGYEYCGIAASSSPGWFCPYTYCWIAPPDPPTATV